MFGLLFPSKRFDHLQRNMDSKIRALIMRVDLLERVVSGQAATISRLTADQEKTRIAKDFTHGKAREKQAQASRSSNLRSSVRTFRSSPAQSGAETRTQHYSAPTSVTVDDPAPSHHHGHHHHHHHSGSDFGGYDSGCSDSSSSFSGCD